jgi:sensor histidine kinase
LKTNNKKVLPFRKVKNEPTLLTLTPKEVSELVLEGIVTLCIVFLLYLGILVMVSQLINEPGFISVEFSAREVWHIEREQIAFYKNIFTITSVVFAVAFTYWRLMRRYQQMQLNHILEELHLIADGQYDRRIPFRLSGDMGQVVNSINRLVDSTVNALEDERAIEKSKDELITNVSHDIRTPLTSILGYLGLIVNQPNVESADAKRYAEIAYSKAEQMKLLVDDLFEYTTTRPNGAPLRLNDIPIVNFLEQVAADFELEAQKRKMAIEVLPNNRDVVLELDAEKMVRVINNLLSNAIKYGHEDSVITMEVLKNDGVITIAVRNAGDPISKEVLEQLFARFYRAEASRSKETGGTGLGLAIAENIVKSHGGMMYAESENGQTSFYVCLPEENQGSLKQFKEKLK